MPLHLTVSDLSALPATTFAGNITLNNPYTLTLSAMSSGRVVYTGTGGVLQSGATFAFDGNKLSLTTTGSTGGILVGGDAALFRGAADRWETPDSVYINGGYLGVGVAPTSTYQIYSRFSGTTSTASTMVFGETFFTASSTPSSQRPRALFFSANQGGAVNYTDALGATGFEGIAGTSSSLTSEGVCGGIVGTQNTGSGTLVRACGLLSNTPTNSGGGHITNTRMIDIAAPNAFTANSQARIGLRIGAIPDPGVYTGTTACGIQFNSTSGAARDGILWGTDTNLYRSAADTLKTDDSFHVGTTFRHLGTNLGFYNATATTQSTGWSVTGGYTTDKAFDPETAGALEVARVLGTLVDALKSYGLLGG